MTTRSSTSGTGPSPKRFDDLRRDYELETIQLPESYRCPLEIVDRANRLIRHNTRLVTSRKTVAVREARGAYADIIRQAVVGRQIEEAEFVGRDIRERGLPPGDCVVLGRTNRLVQFAAEGLQRAGLEAFVPQRKTEFDSPVPSVLAEALRLANSRHDRVVLRRICRQWERMTGVVIEPHSVGAAAALAGGDFLRAWADAVGAEEGRAALQRIPADLVDGLNFPGIVDSFLEGGWRSWGDGGPVDKSPAESGYEEVETWRALHREIVGEYGRGVTLNVYLQRLDLSSKTPAAAPNAVQCHRAPRQGARIPACLPDRDGPGGVSVVSGATEGAAEQGGGGGAAELFRGDHPGAGDADAGAGVLRVWEEGVAVSGGDGGVRGGGGIGQRCSVSLMPFLTWLNSTLPATATGSA